MREAIRSWKSALLAALAVLPLAAPPPASGATAKLSPSALTVIRPAPPDACALLDIPEKRALMDGLLFNLLWSCGRQDELGGVPEDDPAVPPEILDDAQVNNSTGEIGPSATQSETTIAENPLTGTLCSAFNDSWEFYGATGGGGFTGFSRSTDGGASWQDRGAIGSSSFGDPSLVWRRADGRFYLATLESCCDLSVRVSLDDCQSFLLRNSPLTIFADKEILMADNHPTSPHYGSLYLVWTEFGLSSAPIRASRSTDGGLTWSPPATVSTGGIVQGAWPAVAPNGNVYVAWVRYTDVDNGPITIQVSRSTNGGLSYSPVANPLVNAASPRDAGSSLWCGRPALNGFIRYLASPQLAVDSQGVLHVVYSYDPDGIDVGDVVDVFYRRSTDGGATWSPEVRLNDDLTLSDQYFPTVQISGSTVLASWYDRRLDPANYLQSYFKRISTDGGLTWQSSQRVSDVPSPIYNDPQLAPCYHGDYDQSLLTATGRQVVQWADDRNVCAGHPDPDVWTDRDP